MTVCAKLHNFCLDKLIPISANRYYEDIQVNDLHEVVLNDEEIVGDALQPNFYATRRTRFTDMFQLRGIRRPMYASINSRA